MPDTHFELKKKIQRRKNILMPLTRSFTAMKSRTTLRDSITRRVSRGKCVNMHIWKLFCPSSLYDTLALADQPTDSLKRTNEQQKPRERERERERERARGRERKREKPRERPREKDRERERETGNE
jgi:hypothetical protein